MLKLAKRQDAERKRLQASSTASAKASKARQAQTRVKMLERLKPVSARVRGGPRDRLPARKRSAAALTLRDVAVGYEPGKPVLRSLTLRLDADDRIALLGANGNGKSTLTKLIAGRLAPMAGEVRAPRNSTFGYFAQHQIEELDPEARPSIFPPPAGGAAAELRTHLARSA